MKDSEIKYQLSQRRKKEIDQAVERLLRIKRKKFRRNLINAPKHIISFGYKNIYRYGKKKSYRR